MNSINLRMVFKKLFMTKLFILVCLETNTKNYEKIYKKLISEVDNITNFQIQNIKEYKIYKILINNNEL